MDIEAAGPVCMSTIIGGGAGMGGISTMANQWAICPDCHRWNETPAGFNPVKHFCRCASCKSLMYLIGEDPLEAAYQQKDKTEISLVAIPRGY